MKQVNQERIRVWLPAFKFQWDDQSKIVWAILHETNIKTWEVRSTTELWTWDIAKALSDFVKLYKNRLDIKRVKQMSDIIKWRSKHVEKVEYEEWNKHKSLKITENLWMKWKQK